MTLTNERKLSSASSLESYNKMFNLGEINAIVIFTTLKRKSQQYAFHTVTHTHA